jgi:prepilin-type N-terminal cleavage/methylation domain-containing protein
MVRTIQRARRRSAGRIDDDAGFTMVELVVSIMIFALTIAAIAAGMSTAFNLTRGNRGRSVAANLAAQEMDTVRSTSFANLAIGQLTTTQTVSGVAYTVARQTEWVTQSGSSGSCGVPSGQQQLRYLSIVVTVSWANMSGVAPITSSTVLAPPAGTGSIETAVLDRTGAGVSNATVTLTNSDGNTSTKTTASNGCALFTSLQPGAFSVAVTKTGYVDTQGAAAPSQSVDVYSGGIYGVQFDYDQAATINPLTLQAISGSIPAAVQNAPVTISNSGLAIGKIVVAGSGLARGPFSNLFPFTNGYEAWAGNCNDADPGATALLVSMTPGGTSSGTISMPRITVQTRNLSNLARPTVAITATHIVDTGCAAGATYALGSTNASGNLTTVALPFGLWTISAAGQSSPTCTGGTPSGLCKVTLVGGGSGTGVTPPTLTIKW